MFPKRLELVTLLLSLGILSFSWFMASYFNNLVPEPRNEENSFSAFSAQAYLKRLTSFGPRTAGSYANDVQAVTFLRDTILDITKRSKGQLTVDLDIQNVTAGSFVFPHGMAQQYSSLLNVVVKIFSADVSQADQPAVLINCHFDSVPQGPGASDDGANCAVMLEILRVLVNSPAGVLRNNVILLMNGAEEMMLPAAHGFITQHPWAKHVKAFINLEGAGSGGRELLFQSGPGNPWLIRTFISQAPHPFASVLAQEIFQSGLIPSDSDFRIFRDYGGLPGLDIAYIKNGYVYHTEHDTADRIPIETLQRMGDNVLAVTRALADMDGLGSDTSTTTHVFFDVFGLFMVSYPQWAGIVINVSCILLAGCILLHELCILCKKIDVSKTTLLKVLAITSTSNLLIVVFSVGVVCLTAVLLGKAGKSMSWYSSPWLLVPLYVSPTLLASFLGILIIQTSLQTTLKQNKLEKSGVEEMMMFHSVQLFFILPCLVLTSAGYNSAFMFSMPVLFNLIYSLIVNYVIKQPCGLNKEWANFLIYLFLQIIPLMMWSYMIQLVFVFFVPIMGRNGTTSNPDLRLGIITCLSCYILVQPLLPLLVGYSRRTSLLLLSLSFITFFVTVAVLLLSKSGFPYSGNVSHPAQKRMHVHHFRRSRGDFEDGGILFARLDYPDTAQLNNIVKEFGDAAVVPEEECQAVLGCSLPVIKRNLKDMNGLKWIPSSIPNITSNKVNLEIIHRNSGGGSMNLTLGVSGPNWRTLVFAPKTGVTLKKWSISEDVFPIGQWNSRDVFFINIIQGLNVGIERVWLELDLPKDWRKEDGVLDAVLTGHHHHGQKQHSEFLRAVVDQFPDWVSLSAWVVDVAIYSV